MPACHAGDRRFESGRVRHSPASIHAPSARPDGASSCPLVTECRPVNAASAVAPRRRRPRRARASPFRSAAGCSASARRRVPRRRRRAPSRSPPATPGPPRPTPRRRRRRRALAHRANHRDAGADARPSPTSRSCPSPSSGRRGPRRTARKSKPCWRDEHALPGARARRGRRRRDPRRARIGAARPPRRRLDPGQGRDDARSATWRSTASDSASSARSRSGRPSARSAGATRTLFGVDRVTDPGEWRLTAHSRTDGDGHDGFDPATPGRLFAGGDILLDRGVHQTSRSAARARTSRSTAAPPRSPATLLLRRSAGSPPHTHARPATRGAMRDLIKGADVAIANFENPAPNRFRWHTSGDGLLGRPDATSRGSSSAGIDCVSIANNHIGDAGAQRHRSRRSTNLDEARTRALGRGQGPRRRPASRRSSRRTGPRSRSSATTRSPATTTRRRRRRQRPADAQERQGRTSPRRARPARTS